VLTRLRGFEMIIVIAVLVTAFSWLLKETDWLRVRLLAGKEVVLIDYRRVWIDTFHRQGFFRLEEALTAHVYPSFPKEKKVGYTFYNCLKPKGKPSDLVFEVTLSPGVKDVLCGTKWLDKHWNDLVDYVPAVQMNIGGVRYDMTIKTTEIIPAIMKANHMTRAQVRAQAVK